MADAKGPAAKERKGSSDELESLAIVLAENPILKQRVVEKMKAILAESKRRHAGPKVETKDVKEK